MGFNELSAWWDESKSINTNVVLKIGDRVINDKGNVGVVVKINKPESTEEDDHGTIYVWQEDLTDYGSDNCEHYCYTNWQSFLRLIDETVQKSKSSYPLLSNLMGAYLNIDASDICHSSILSEMIQFVKNDVGIDVFHEILDETHIFEFDNPENTDEIFDEIFNNEIMFKGTEIFQAIRKLQ
jgi:hypothetical protein